MQLNLLLQHKERFDHLVAGRRDEEIERPQLVHRHARLVERRLCRQPRALRIQTRLLPRE